MSANNIGENDLIYLYRTSTVIQINMTYITKSTSKSIVYKQYYFVIH